MAAKWDNDSLLSAAQDGFTDWEDGSDGLTPDEGLEQEFAQERLAKLENELEQAEKPIDYDAELETEEEEAAPTSEKRLKREMRAEALRRLEDAARTEADFLIVVGERAAGIYGGFRSEDRPIMDERPGFPAAMQRERPGHSL